MTIEALVFDFDGLILETETVVYESIRAQFVEHGHDLPLRRWIDKLGVPAHKADFMADLERLVGQPLDREEMSQRRRTHVLALLQEQPAMPGVEQYIADAKRLGLGLGVASGSSRRWVEEHLQRLGMIEQFEAIVCAEDTAEHKPHPAPYLAVAERLDVPPRRAAALEDSVNGVRSAKAAGMFAVAVPTVMTRDECFDEADAVVDSLDAVPLEDLLQTLDGSGDVRE